MRSTIDQADTAMSDNPAHATEDTVQLLRDELKARLLKSADEFKVMKSKGDSIKRETNEVPGKATAEKQSNDRGYVVRLLHRIVRKIWKRKRASERKLSKSSEVLTSDSFRQVKLDVGVAGNKVIELAEQLALLNPSLFPTLGFTGYGGADPSESKLAGTWQLRFTTAADASFPESEKRGAVTTTQEIDTEEGTLTNVIDFERGRLKGFRVVVDGEPLSSTDIGLTFRAVRIIRKSRFPRLFGQFTVPLPSRLIRWFATRNKTKEDGSNGPYLRLRYLDDNLRMHTTDSGNWFIQTRIE